jgi:DNA polymerase-3 subunit chi
LSDLGRHRGAVEQEAHVGAVRIVPTEREQDRLRRRLALAVAAVSLDQLRGRRTALDAHLWTYREESFLPHGSDRESEAAAQPILLTLGGDNPNGADVRFLLDGAAMPAEIGQYRRIVLLFDGEDAEALAAARERWTAAKASGFDVTYWQMDDHGRWQRQA